MTQTPYFQVYPSGQEWRFRIKAVNHLKLAHGGQAYTNKLDCLAAVALINGRNDYPVNVYDRDPEVLPSWRRFGLGGWRTLG